MQISGSGNYSSGTRDGSVTRLKATAIHHDIGATIATHSPNTKD